MRVIFILPGLLLPATDVEKRDLRSLKYLLAHSDMGSSVEAHEGLLFLAFITPDHAIVTESQAAYWSDFSRRPAGYCYYCEPVHLRADLSDAIVFDRSQFIMDMAEARALVEAINGYLQDDSCSVELAGSGHWYLLSDTRIAGEIPKLREIEGHPVGAVLTDPAFAPMWRRLMNELQMVLHHQSVNTEREQRGELTINGVWIHEGAAMEAPGYAVKRVVTESPAAQAACREFALDFGPELGMAESAGREGDILVFDDSLKTDAVSRKSRLEWMERHWFEPACTWLRHGKIDEIIIDPADGRRFTVRRNFLKRFWKRTKPLASYAKQMHESKHTH